LSLLAGSDVSGIKTTARRVGDKYIVNGSKKWITNAIWADYCTTAVRTGGPGRGGISLLIVPLAAKGVTRRKLENSGVLSSGSTFIEFDDVEVPAENLIGVENEGFKYIMSSMLCRIAQSMDRQNKVLIADADISQTSTRNVSEWQPTASGCLVSVWKTRSTMP
jgi:alkylation response protein AidB-like acyl-CoA dehydrogenase